MAVVPVGIAVSLITLYLLNRIGQKLLAFEHMFFLGLKYCMEPTPADLAAVAATSAGAAAFGGAVVSSKDKGSKGKKKGKHAGSSSASGAGKKPKATPSNLPIVRNSVNENMFIGEPTLPKSIEFSYLMGMVSSFLIAFAVEEGVMCLLPGTSSKFNVSQTHWFGALIFTVSMFELISMTISMTSPAITGMLLSVGTVLALALIANGDSSSFFMLDSAFANIHAWAEHVHIERLSLDVSIAPRYARTFTTIARVGTAFMAGLLFTSTAVAARRFSNLDYEMRNRYVRDEEEAKADVYALPKPSQFLMAMLALDYVLPVLALTTFLFGRPSDALEPFDPARVCYFVGAVSLRILLTRVRLQAYLDTAVTQFRNFWMERRTSPGGDLEAGQRLRTRVVTTYYYISTLGSLYTFGPVVGLMLSLIAKRSGGLSLGICDDPASAVERMSLTVAAREIFSFLAWYYFAAYALFSTLSFGFDALVEWADPPPPLSATDGGSMEGMSSSERRKLRRDQEKANKEKAR